MDDGKLLVSVSDQRREFIEDELASGAYSSETEIIDAALELLQKKRKLDALRASIAEGDADIAAGRIRVSENADELRHDLAKAEAGGESGRQVPDIMNAVKARMRANGSL